jgi:hypothetical protein
MLQTMQPNEPSALREKDELQALSIKADKFSLLGGREYFYAHFGVNASDFNAAADTSLAIMQELLQFESMVLPGLFESTVRDMENSLLRSLEEFAHELSGGGREHEQAPSVVSFRDLVNASNKQEGYVLWLTNVDPRELETLQVLPILPSTDTIESIVKEKRAEFDSVEDETAAVDDERIVGKASTTKQRQQRQTNQQRFIKGAKTFASAARSVLSDTRIERSATAEAWVQDNGRAPQNALPS